MPCRKFQRLSIEIVNRNIDYLDLACSEIVVLGQQPRIRTDCSARLSTRATMPQAVVRKPDEPRWARWEGCFSRRDGWLEPAVVLLAKIPRQKSHSRPVPSRERHLLRPR